MGATEKISGRIGSRLVGLMELLLTTLLLAAFVWNLRIFCEKLHEPLENKNGTKLYNINGYKNIDVIISITLGTYFVVGICVSAVLILSTFAVIGLNVRKWIAVFWCLFNMVSFIGAVVLIGMSALCQDIVWFFFMIGFLIKSAVFFCIVCTYVWGLSEIILDKKMYAMPMSPVNVRRKRFNTGSSSSIANTSTGDTVAKTLNSIT